MDNSPPAYVVNEQSTEDELVSVAQLALSSCNWTIGQCAHLWVQSYARGRTDEDFGARIGLSGDQIRQRRLVWERWGKSSDMYPNMKWSHFYVALTWDDAEACLQWASDLKATVAEMKSWRRSQHGEDLTQPGSEDGDADEEQDSSGVPERANRNQSDERQSPSGPPESPARERSGAAQTRTQAPEASAPRLRANVDWSMDAAVMELRYLAKRVQDAFPFELADFADECRSIAARFDGPNRKRLARFDPRNAPLPTELKHDKFESAWADWCDFRSKEKRKPLTESGATNTLKKLARYSPDVAVAAIRESIANDWTGLFPDKIKLGGSQSTAEARTSERDEQLRRFMEDGDE